MHHILKAHHPRRHAQSFKFAFEGLFHTLINEPNFRVQIIITVTCVIFGFMFNISLIEWGLLIISLGFLLSAEMINTVVENFVDVLIKEYHNGAKIIKDVSAGFVLIAAVTTMIILIIIFWEHLRGLFI
ncbi:hypothetical protein A2V49_01945 [candidate division WWE3 bacterium RBG_19FT_COMBO_34_6]|uniref:Diacylglycerol kinase n=1 Tax=candidate division WWE3 bacterium RBG_19FT_COMBO_34_6 TaxID=1802612 RepID=A0A1F4UM04_UNCKA|nr:MAG: hypothetical protein A2V49_01945 [candidate division WWE3 bacterium RBG_19FT_COMBO_34_6]